MKRTTLSRWARSGVALAVLVLGQGCGGSDDGDEGSSKPDTKAFMTSYFDTFDAKVTDDILALYSETVTADITALGKLEGRNAVRDTWLTPFTTAFPDYVHTVNTITVTDGRADVDFVFSGTHQGPLLGFQPSGKPLELPIKGTYDVENDVVTYFKLEYDVQIVLDAIKP